MVDFQDCGAETSGLGCFSLGPLPGHMHLRIRSCHLDLKGPHQAPPQTTPALSLPTPAGTLQVGRSATRGAAVVWCFLSQVSLVNPGTTGLRVSEECGQLLRTLGPSHSSTPATRAPPPPAQTLTQWVDLPQRANRFIEATAGQSTVGLGHTF